VVAELIGGQWPKLLRAAFHELCPPRNPDAADDFNGEGNELGEPLVRDLARIWVRTRQQPFYISEILRQKLRGFPDRPWVTMNKGFGLSLEKMGSLLRAFNVKSVQRRIGGGQRHIGYLLTDLDPLFRSYASDIWNQPASQENSDVGSSPDPEPAEPAKEPEKNTQTPERGFKPPLRL
jgi:hypothetical protein